MRLTRRHLLQALAASSLAPAGRLARASQQRERRFLFLFCTGGWDPTYVFTPLFGSAGVDMPEDSELDQIGGIPFTNALSRPSVPAFLQRWGDQTAILNGVEVRSVTHERCRQLMLTGSGEGGVDDWPSILAGNARSPLLMPHLVVAGPAFTANYTANVVRVGDAAQLPHLLDGSALQWADRPVDTPAAGPAALEDAFVRARAEAMLARAGVGAEKTFASRYRDALDQAGALAAFGDRLDLEVAPGSCERDLLTDFSVAFDVFSLGLSRCAMLRYNGWCDEGWDTHTGVWLQDRNFEDLFAYLDAMMEDLATRTTEAGTMLKDEVTIVVLSEMGRHPLLNTWGGKDHWTFTSCMLLGSGIKGDQVVGGLDESSQGDKIDLATGESTDSGEGLLPQHLGATLLALGDVDPGEFSGGVEPIGALLA